MTTTPSAPAGTACSGRQATQRRVGHPVTTVYSSTSTAPLPSLQPTTEPATAGPPEPQPQPQPPPPLTVVPPVKTKAGPRDDMGGEEEGSGFTTPTAVTEVDPTQYDGQLQQKLRRVTALFANLLPPEVGVEVFESPPV